MINAINSAAKFFDVKRTLAAHCSSAVSVLCNPAGNRWMQSAGMTKASSVGVSCRSVRFRSSDSRALSLSLCLSLSQFIFSRQFCSTHCTGISAQRAIFSTAFKRKCRRRSAQLYVFTASAKVSSADWRLGVYKALSS